MEPTKESDYGIANGDDSKIVADKVSELHGFDNPVGPVDDVNVVLEQPQPIHDTVGEPEEESISKDNFQSKMWAEHFDGRCTIDLGGITVVEVRMAVEEESEQNILTSSYTQKYSLTYQNKTDSADAWIRACQEKIDAVTGELVKEVKENKAIIKKGILGVIFILYLAYLIWACVRDIREAAILLGLTIFAILVFIYTKVRDNFGETIWERIGKPTVDHLEEAWVFTKWVIIALILIGIVVGLYFLTRENTARLISAFGLLVFVFFTYVFSKYPRHVKWRPVYWGLALQLIFGVLILRTEPGLAVFTWLGDFVTTILGFSDAGAQFVFGDAYEAHFFAFKVLPTVIYFSAAISVLYHLGVMQVVIRKIAWLMQHTMKTSATESLNAAGNIFIGQSESPLMIRPLLKDMTKSELHAVMTGGFATIAGSVLGAYISFGISASHLLSASVMSAPAALAISKLFYPETKKSSTKSVSELDLPKGEHRNVVEAASYGAYTGVPLALNIAGNLIAFLAILALFDGLLGYLGALVGIPQLGFTFICGYVFLPLAWLMGVEPKDCRLVAELLGAKTFINEFYAYDQLAILIKNRINGVPPFLTIRSEVITTYALCGFANFGSMGIQLGALTPMAPSRKSDLADLAVRALIAGSVACFMTACIAGILYDESTYDAGAIIRLMSDSTTPASAAAGATTTVGAVLSNGTTAVGATTVITNAMNTLSTQITQSLSTAVFNTTV